MIQNIIKVDYVLSAWFSKTSDKVIPGTAFLFLNKVVFLWTSIFFVVTGLLPIEISMKFYIGILVVGGVIIIYGFQKKTERYVESLDLKKKYSKLPKEKVKRNRLLGLVFFSGSFMLIFLMVVLFH